MYFYACLADRLERDEDLRKLVLRLINSETMVRLMGGYVPDGFNIEDELDEALLDAADEMWDEAAWIGRQMETMGFTWILAVEGKNVRQIRISAQNGNYALVYEAEGTASDKRTELLCVISYGDRQSLAERSHTKKGNQYGGRVTVTIPLEGSVTLDYGMDRGKTSVFGIPYGEYRLSVPGENASVNLKVEAGAKDGVDPIFSISADSC